MTVAAVPAIDDVLTRAVERGDVPNVVALAADRDGIVYEGAAGPRAVGQDDPVGPDTHFRIMSMTKMVATVAALQLMEQGKLDLDAPIEQYCPEWGELQVLDGFDGDTPILRAPKTQATVLHLITHTSGLTYWFWNADILKFETVTGTPNVLAGSDAIFTSPLVCDPGEKLEYGTNTDWLGRVVEAVAGAKLDAVIKAGITDPLGMTQTTFLMDDAQRANSTPVHVPGEDGWLATDIDLNQSPDYWAGGHGLYSTPHDYAKFQRMLLGNGTVDGTTILASETVDAAFTNQIGELEFPAHIATADPQSSCDFDAGPGWKWGHGLLLNTEDVPGRRHAGSGAWAGLANTHFWVDRDAGITGAIYTQFLPFVLPSAYQLYVDFETALYASR